MFSSKSRLEKIVADIIFDMETKDRLKSGRGNAMLVASSIYEACKYYELFLNSKFDKCAIVTSYNPNISDIKGETTGDAGATEKQRKYEIYTKMLGDKKLEDFEKEVKKKFVEEPAQMKLLIVVDKLLTGFDAPPATYLYIDRSMRDHGLFQAICRVNRLDGEDKDYGYIVDYKDLFNSIENAMDDYTSNAFDSYEKSDVEGLLKNRLVLAKERLDEMLESVQALCEPVEYPRGTQQFIHYFCSRNTENREELKNNESKRVALYKMVSSLIRAYANIANEMHKAGYSKEDAIHIKKEVTYYEKMRSEVRLASGDYVDLKTYEPAMRHLIDTYINAEESKVLADFDHKSIVEILINKKDKVGDSLPEGLRQSNETIAETIENNVRKLIVDEMPTNPKYFEKMPTLLDEIIRHRKEKVLAYKEYLKKLADLANKAKHPEESAEYPEAVKKSQALRALYDNIGDVAIAEALHKDIISQKPDNWRATTMKKRSVEKIVKKHIKIKEQADNIYKIVVEQKEY